MPKNLLKKLSKIKKIMGKKKYNQCHHMQSTRDKVQ